MKLILQSTTFLFAGILLFSACSEEKTGKVPEKIVEELTGNLEKVLPDSIPLDTAVVEKAKPKIMPPPPPMPPPGPMPEPDPWPDPDPWPIKPPPPPAPMPDPYPIVDFAQVEPIYPGDSNTDHTKMMKFISDNIEFPEMDKEQGNQGKVYVEFVVETDGSLTNVRVLRGVSETLDREAVRVIKLMPKWIPGQQNGKTVRCRTRLPITFRLG